MHPTKSRLVLGISSLILLALTLILLSHLLSIDGFSASSLEQIVILTVLMNLLLMFVWIGLGILPGVISSVVLCCVFIYFKSFSAIIAIFAFGSLVVTAVVGYRLFRECFIIAQMHEIENEKIDENTNLLQAELEQNKKEISHLERRFTRYTHLNEITERLSSTLSEEEIAAIIVEETCNIFGKSDRVLLFRIDIDRQELRLMHSKKKESALSVRLKKGDIFDRWVIWKRQPLLLENTRKDFRFSLDDTKIDKAFSSLIAVPLLSSDKVLGLLRLDSKLPSCYTQDDLRLLDIISGLAIVALENAILYKSLSKLAITDGLTSLYVHSFFKEKLEKETQRFFQTSMPFSLILFDIDNFKTYNDKYGHMAGDLVLKHIASILNKNLEGGDIAARYGGEEFAVLLLDKAIKEAGELAENLRKNIKEKAVTLRRQKTNVTVSIGVSSCPRDSNSAEDLFRYADRRLYKAKQKGKNRVCMS